MSLTANLGLFQAAVPATPLRSKERYLDPSSVRFGEFSRCSTRLQHTRLSYFGPSRQIPLQCKAGTMALAILNSLRLRQLLKEAITSSSGRMM